MANNREKNQWNGQKKGSDDEVKKESGWVI